MVVDNKKTIFRRNRGIPKTQWVLALTNIPRFVKICVCVNFTMHLSTITGGGSLISFCFNANYCNLVTSFFPHCPFCRTGMGEWVGRYIRGLANSWFNNFLIPNLSIFASAGGGPFSQICVHETLRYVPHQKFSAELPSQILKSNIQRLLPLQQYIQT